MLSVGSVVCNKLVVWISLRKKLIDLLVLTFVSSPSFV